MKVRTFVDGLNNEKSVLEKEKYVLLDNLQAWQSKVSLLESQLTREEMKLATAKEAVGSIKLSKSSTI